MTLLLNDTIAAISTPPGLGGIAVLRLSGQEAIGIVSPLFKGGQGGVLLPNSASFARIEHHGEFIDEVVISYFKAPRSYTGEDVIEISCHGGRYAANKILELLILSGARQARPGEFTERAFLNGKLDLAQAEAVAGLIHARTEQAGKAAARQLSGGLSQKVRTMRSKLLDLLALLELELDFSEEDVEFQTRASREATIRELEREVSALAATFTRGRLVREGIRIAIIGAPNAGKSTLLNALVGEDRAIVSSEPGTTRDVVEARLELAGIEVILQDTAGIRESEGDIEAQGISRSYRAIEHADLIMLVIDESQQEWPLDDLLSSFILHPSSFLGGESGKPLILIRNKTDLRAGTRPALEIPANLSPHAIFEISARDHTGMEALLDGIVPLVMREEIANTEIVITEARHAVLLNQAVTSLAASRAQLANPTLMAADLRDAVTALGEIIGESIGEEILDRIFSKFCIGK